MDAALAIETAGLAKRFGAVDAVAGVDLGVPLGSVFGFLGPNGAGKTTTIRMLVGLIAPTRGSVAVLGLPVRPGSADLGAVGALVERPAFYPYLSAADNLRLFAATHGAAGATIDRRIAAALERTGLAPVAGRRVGGFSTGMRQRLGLALATLHDPRLVILDEPTNGLDPAGVVEVRSIIADLAHAGTTVFLSSHVLTEVEQVCDRVAVVSHGRIVASGAPSDLVGGVETLQARFDTAAELTAAAALLASAGIAAAALDGPGQTVMEIALPASDGSRVVRLLAGGGVYPAELTARHRTLEAAFLELTREAPGAATAADNVQGGAPGAAR